jgi:integrase
MRATVFKRKGRKARPWVCRYGPSNKVQRSFATRREAEAFKAKMDGQPTPADPALFNVTLADFAERWIAGRRAQAATGQGLKPRTLAAYEGHLRKHVLPTLGAHKVRDIRQGQVLYWIRDRAACGLKVSSLRATVAPLQAILGEAVFLDIVGSNAATLAWREFRRGVKVSKDDVRYKGIPAGDVEAIVGASSPRYRPLFAVLAATGLRPGEGLALRLEDVDLNGPRGVLHVRHTLALAKKGLSPEDRLGSAKTKSGVRDVQLSRDTEEMLRHHVAYRKAENLEKGWTAPWLFAGPTGRPLDHSMVARELKGALKASGKSSAITPHVFRHAWASRMLAAGAPLTWVSGMLGHSTPAFTLKVYAHAIPTSGDQYADMIDTPKVAARKAAGEKSSDHLVTTPAKTPLKSRVLEPVYLQGV